MGRAVLPSSGSKRASQPSAAPAACITTACKDCQPNWSVHEIFALIGAKRELYLEEIDAVDARDFMNPEASKWNRISQQVMGAGHSPCMCDGLACKAKWNQLLPNYKRIVDFHARTGHNTAD